MHLSTIGFKEVMWKLTHLCCTRRIFLSKTFVSKDVLILNTEK